MSDEFVETLVQYMMRPLPKAGDKVIANGRVGTIIQFLPGEIPGKPGFVTCTVTYVIDHGGELATYVVNDWDSGAPKVELLEVTHVDGSWWFETRRPRRFRHKHAVHTTSHGDRYETQRCACGALQFSDMPGWVARGKPRFRPWWRLW